MKLNFLVLEDRFGRRDIKQIVYRGLERHGIDSELDELEKGFAEKVFNEIAYDVYKVVDPDASFERRPLVRFVDRYGNGGFLARMGLVVIGLETPFIQVGVDRYLVRINRVIEIFCHELVHYVQWVRSGYRENMLDVLGGTSTGMKSIGVGKKSDRGSMIDYSHRPEEITAHAGDAASDLVGKYGDDALLALRHLKYSSNSVFSKRSWFQLYSLMDNEAKNRFRREVVRFIDGGKL